MGDTYNLSIDIKGTKIEIADMGVPLELDGEGVSNFVKDQFLTSALNENPFVLGKLITDTFITFLHLGQIEDIISSEVIDNEIVFFTNLSDVLVRRELFRIPSDTKAITTEGIIKHFLKSSLEDQEQAMLVAVGVFSLIDSQEEMEADFEKTMGNVLVNIKELLVVTKVMK